MASDFSPVLFFQRVPLPLLERFFHERHQVLLDIDFGQLKENGDPAQVLFEAFQGMQEKRAEMEGECQIIDQMAVHGGIAALITEATSFPHHDKTFPERMAQFETFQGRAISGLDNLQPRWATTLVPLPRSWLWSARGDPLRRPHLRLSSLLPVGIPQPAGNLG